MLFLLLSLGVDDKLKKGISYHPLTEKKIIIFYNVGWIFKRSDSQGS